MTEVCVLDSFAVLALLGGEPGGEQVAELMRRAPEKVRLLMTWVNLGEVAHIVQRRWGEARLYEVLAILEATTLEFVAVGRELALAAARIKAAHPMAFADSFAAGLAEQTGGTLWTGDPEFRLLEDVLDIRWLP